MGKRSGERPHGCGSRIKRRKVEHSSRDGRKCFTCGLPGHVRAWCPQGKQVVCHKCKKVGHLAQDCRNCFRCGQPGHLKKYCPQGKQQNVIQWTQTIWSTSAQPVQQHGVQQQQQRGQDCVLMQPDASGN